MSAAVDRSLRNQLRWRLLWVFLGVCVLGNAILLVGYHLVLRDGQRAESDGMAEHVLRAHQLSVENQQLNADELAAQIAFLRIFADDPGTTAAKSWLRLRAFFGAMEGKTGRFPSGVVLRGDGGGAFSFGADGKALEQLLAGKSARPAWYFSPQQRTTFVLYSTPLWLGSSGRGSLVLALPLDNGWMRMLAPVDSELVLTVDGQAVASSLGSQGMGRAVDAAFTGRLLRDGVWHEQRPLPIFGSQPDAPRMVLLQRSVEPVSTATLLAIGTGLMGLLALALWLVVGRWSQRLTDRVAELSRATALFAQERHMGSSLYSALGKAAAKPDEVADVARSCGELMQSVVDRERENQEHSQNLDRLNQELEGRVAQRTTELTRTVDTLTRTQKELVESEKLASLGAMVAGISHELNTPIGNAVTVSSTLHDQLERFKEQFNAGALKRSSMNEFLASMAEASDLILRSVQRAAGLVASFKQVAADRESERQREFNLQALVHDMVTSLKPGMRHKDVVIEDQVPDSLVCNSFPGPIGQVLTNLIQNAVLHGFAEREGGRIQIRAELQGIQVIMTVTDDGQGMTPEVLKHAFDPFFTTRLGKGGSGLGLSVSHRIATAVLGGSLTAESTVGQGSSFRFTFKREAPHAQGEEE